MTYEQVQKLIGRKVVEVGRYEDGFWLKLDDGTKTFIDPDK